MPDNTIEPVDGSVYAYQASPHEALVYVTIAGPDEDKPMLVAFDLADLKSLAAARIELKHAVEALRKPPRTFVTHRTWTADEEDN